MLSVQSAREIVLEHCRRVARQDLPLETVSILDSLGRVAAEPILVDRDQPPFDRSMRDGFAIIADDLSGGPVDLICTGEIKAGDLAGLQVQRGEAVQIMTGAPVPAGATAVVMVEHTERKPGARLRVLKPVKAGDNIAPRGSERNAGDRAFDVGKRIASLELAVLATVGKSAIKVFGRPRVAILATGDELVEVTETPGPTQIRNSNSFSLYAQVLKCGGQPSLLEIARDDSRDLKRLISQGLAYDVLLVTGGVSMGKYDLVETVFAELGVRIHFEAVSMRPGKPTVFGTSHGRFVFGLPGNPVSTFVAFEVFVKPVVHMLQGLPADALPAVRGFLQKDVTEKSGRTAFLPARVSSSSRMIEVSAVQWKGSADIFSAVEANGFLVVPMEATRLSSGSSVEALLFDDLIFLLEGHF